jgi:hypothetical protein
MWVTAVLQATLVLAGHLAEGDEKRKIEPAT